MIIAFANYGMGPIMTNVDSVHERILTLTLLLPLPYPYPYP